MTWPELTEQEARALRDRLYATDARPCAYCDAQPKLIRAPYPVCLEITITHNDGCSADHPKKKFA